MLIKKDKKRELITYLIVGLLSTFINLGSYFLLTNTILNPLNVIELELANVISFVIALIFAYIANRMYVFKSTNKNRFKEFISFVSFRVITLILDMLIMYVGVSILHLDNRIVKIFSQILVVIFNYIFSKCFVFTKKNYYIKIHFKYEYILFLIYIVIFLFKNSNYSYVLLIVLIIYMMILMMVNLRKGRNILINLLILLSISIGTIYSFINKLEYLDKLYNLLTIFLLPLSIISFKKDKEYNLSSYAIFSILMLMLLYISESYISMIPYIYIVLLYIDKSFNYLSKLTLLIFTLIMIIMANNQLIYISVIIYLLYLIIRRFKYHKYIYLFIILLSISYIGYIYKDYVMDTFNILDTLNINEVIFGFKSDNLMVNYGLLMSIIYLLIYLYCILKKDFIVSITMLLIPFMSKSLINEIMLILGLTLYCRLNIKNDKRILIVSNMYPSNKYPYYGSFVRNTYKYLSNSYNVDIVYLTKSNNKILKLLKYLLFYIKAFIKSTYGNYNYIYVHFYTHSIIPVILGRKYSRYTKLVLNFHGNDLISDSKEEEESKTKLMAILDSIRAIDYVDTFVVPSKYFKETLIGKYNVSENKIVIYQSGGIDFEVFYNIDRNEALKHLKLSDKYEYIGYIGRIEKDKGWDTFVKMIKELDQDKYRFIMLGSGEEDELLDELITKEKVKVIRYKMVHQSELIYYYNALTCLVFPTKRKSESLGLVGLEAMACKVPLVVNVTYGPSSYADSSNSFPYKKDSDLVKVISKMLKMSNKDLDIILEEGYKTAKEYDKNIINEKLYEIFK